MQDNSLMPDTDPKKNRKARWATIQPYLVASLIFFAGCFLGGTLVNLFYITDGANKPPTSDRPIEIVVATDLPDATSLPSVMTPSTPTPIVSATPTMAEPTNIPTETSTPEPVIYVVSTTAGDGINLRDEPGGTLLQVLPNGTEVIILPDESIIKGGYTWVHIQVLSDNSISGWVADTLLTRK